MWASASHFSHALGTGNVSQLKNLLINSLTFVIYDGVLIYERSRIVKPTKAEPMMTLSTL